MRYHSSRIRDWNENDSLQSRSRRQASRLPPFWMISNGATKEAFEIVLALAFDNMADEDEMPEIYKQQSEALEIVTEIAKYYGSRR